MTANEMPEYAYHGARSLILLHEHHLRRFLFTWEITRRDGVALPAVGDPT